MYAFISDFGCSRGFEDGSRWLKVYWRWDDKRCWNCAALIPTNESRGIQIHMSSGWKFRKKGTCWVSSHVLTAHRCWRLVQLSGSRFSLDQSGLGSVGPCSLPKFLNMLPQTRFITHVRYPLFIYSPYRRSANCSIWLPRGLRRDRRKRPK